jgi:hypothetical protein
MFHCPIQTQRPSSQPSTSIGKATWKSAPYLDSTTLRVRPSLVLLKVPSNDGVTISFNKMMAAFTRQHGVGDDEHLHGSEPWLAGAAYEFLMWQDDAGGQK